MSLTVNGVILVARCFTLIPRNTHAIAITSPIPKIMLNATGLGILSSTLSTVIETVTDVKITVVITGPIAPPTILIIFVTAEEIPVYSLGENETIVLINVVGNSAPAIPNIKSAPLIDCDVEWKSKSNKNETAVIAMPGTNNFVFSPLLFAIINPKIGPKIIIDRPKANCRSPTWVGSSPNPDGEGSSSQLWYACNNEIL